ncbi:MAG: alkaline phosphatase family protein [Aggregatilineales bacterium]
MKKVILFVIDALASRVVFPAMEAGKLPNLQLLCERGEFSQESTAIFPSITPAALSSLVTGGYPDEHGIAGVYWYNTEENTVEFFGADFVVVMNNGIHQFFEQFLVKLSNSLLKRDSLFQKVERAGKTAACLNFFVYQGDVEHKVDVPLLLSLVPGVPYTKNVRGPSTLYMGDFVRASTVAERDSLSGNGGMLNRYGFNDDNTFDILLQMVKTDALSDFTLAYCPDNDWESHSKGPQNALDTLIHFDERLGEVIEAFGGIERMLAEVCVLITGDHSQSDMIEDTESSGIDLSKSLIEFNIVTAGTDWSSPDQVMICPNLRACQIYFAEPTADSTPALASKMINQLLNTPHLDQVIWRDKLLHHGGRGYHVQTASRGELHFFKGEGGETQGRDKYGFAWSWTGDLRTLDGTLYEDGTVSFGAYPNAFERIVSILDLQRSGDLWVTAEVGYDLILPEFDLHEGGSHGSLHAFDSISPLILAGAPQGVNLPAYPRSIDVAPLCLQALGITPERLPGVSAVHPDE